jgi:hypothetical protein
VVSGADEAFQAIEKLTETGLIATDEDDVLTQTDKGSILYKELSDKVEHIIQALYGDLPNGDLDVTHRTLREIAKRANNLLTL